MPAASQAGPYADLDARQKGLTDAQVAAGLRKLAEGDPEAEYHATDSPEAARAYIGLRATLENPRSTPVPKLGPPPKGDRVASSWLARALGGLHGPKFDLPRPAAGPRVGIGGWATALMWTVLAGLAALAAFLLFRNVRFPRRKGRKGIVHEDEPLRTADAWLAEANAQIARGEFREAVRGLYVAGLMRLDEAGVARFDRHQTNWEHLRRIEASPKAPQVAEVRRATQTFDRVWYGRGIVGGADALAMRDWYDGLARSLAEARA